MKKTLVSSVAFAVAVSALALSLFASGPAAATGYLTLDSNSEPLRSAFNSDVGKVRILMLVAPT